MIETNRNEVFQEVIDALGMEVYHVYNDQKKHSVLVTILIGIATSIIFEFIKGFIDFEKLSQKTKTQFEKTLQRISDSKDYEDKAKLKLEVEKLLELLEEERGLKLEQDRMQENIVYVFLLDFGLSEESAREKSQIIFQQLVKRLKK